MRVTRNKERCSICKRESPESHSRTCVPRLCPTEHMYSISKGKWQIASKTKPSKRYSVATRYPKTRYTYNATKKNQCIHASICAAATFATSSTSTCECALIY
ncbi:unnamed protein product [Ectocarpus sp. 12 AP-2014]